MVGVKIMSDFDSNDMNKKTTTISVTAIWLILAIFILVIIGSFFGYSFFKENLELKNKELALWFLFMLFAAIISCIFGAITSHASQKSEEKRERSMVQEIKSFFNEKTEEITSNLNVALQKSDLVFGDQETILHMLMDLSTDVDKIEKIRILAHTSDSFSSFFMDYNKRKKIKCKELNILIHDQAVNGNSKVIKDWNSFCKKNDIKHEIRKAKIRRRSFFGMIIEFERESYHRIGMIGFYKPQDDELLPYKRYGVFNKDSSILDVLNEYFDYYFDDNYSTLMLKNDDDPNKVP